MTCCSVAVASDLGVKFGLDSNSSLPILTLPYQKYRAAFYNSSSDIYTFRNIRFAAPPVGDLRFAAPADPEQNETLADGSYGPQCLQADSGLSGLSAVEAALSGHGPPIPGLPNLPTLPGFNATTLLTLTEGGTGTSAPQSEDCLFLDLYVPGKAIGSPSATSMPVIVWIYGGGFVFGTKDTYAGNGLLESSDNNVIFVAGNYRVGAPGFLAGSTMEQGGLPNAGLADQRAVFEWVKHFAPLFGGDPNDITAWGESAGAGSIFHHMVWRGGEDPGFNKALLESPAFQIQADRRGTLEQTFQNFTALAGCSGQGLTCLRAASSDTIAQANNDLNSNAPGGTYAVGPSADGSNIRQLPALEYASGNYFKGMESLIVSHVQDESLIFVNFNVSTDQAFTTYLQSVLPAFAQSSGILAAIQKFYPAVNNSQAIRTTEAGRSIAFVRDSSFTTNTRFLTDAYNGSTFNLQYSFPPGLHGTDTLPTFFNPDNEESEFTMVDNELPGLREVALAYQGYFTSFTRTGDPNTFSRQTGNLSAMTWPHPASIDAEHLTNVLNVNASGFSLISDAQNPRTPADFWLEVQAALTQVGGYAPPNAVVPQRLVPFSGNASANFGSGT